MERKGEVVSRWSLVVEGERVGGRNHLRHPPTLTLRWTRGYGGQEERIGRKEGRE